MTSRHWRAALARFSEKPIFKSLTQFIKFSIVGISNTLISLAVYYLCYSLLGMHYILANVLAFLVSVTNAFYWNSRYVFAAGERPHWKQAFGMYVKTVTAYGLTFLLSTGLLVFWVELVGVSAEVAPIINLFITMPLNFLLNKHWTFRRKDTGET